MLFYSYQVWKLGELYLCAGRAAECDGLINHAMDVTLDHQDLVYMGELLIVQGRARAMMGDDEGAEESFRSAWSTAMALGAVPSRLTTATHLAELMWRQGRQRQARELLDKTLRSCDPGAPYAGVQRAWALRKQFA